MKSKQECRKRTKRLGWLAAASLFAVGGAGTARADAVTDWNDITSQAAGTAIGAGRPGPATILDFANVHAAIYDAVQAIEGRFEPYHVVIPGASGSPAAATAKAAHDVLVHLYPAQAGTLDATYHNYLAANGLLEDDPGVAVGHAAAAGIIALRSTDGSFPASPPPFTGGSGAGVWRPTPSYLPGPPPSLAPMAAPWLGAVTPFTLTSPTQFRANRPPSVRSIRYLLDYYEVKFLGRLQSTLRTPEQTDIAYFWSENFVAQWNRALRAIAAVHLTDTADTARLFALANLASADSIITSWESKKHFAFWRPVTAIQEGSHDGNPLTVGDPTWQPLINTPNYPDYTSGANNITGAMTAALALFFETDDMTFTVTSTRPEAIQKTRTYARFSDAAQDVVDARVYLGIHFRFADTAARKQGRLCALWAFKNFLRPVDDENNEAWDEEQE